MANGNKARALLLMANHVKAANAIYKNTGFANEVKPEGNEFVVRQLSCMDRRGSPQYYCSNMNLYSQQFLLRWCDPLPS